MTVPRERLSNRRAHESFEFEHGGQHYSAGIGFYEDHRVGEVFLNCGKAGTAVETNARDGAILVSLLLQLRVPISDLRHMLTRDSQGVAMGPLGVVLDLLASGGVP